MSVSINIPLAGHLYVASSGNPSGLLTGISYRGEYHFSVLWCIKGIYTPRNWKYTDYDSIEATQRGD